MHNGKNQSTSTGDLFEAGTDGEEKNNSSNVTHDFFGFVGILAPPCKCNFWHENPECEYCKCSPFQQPDWNEEQRTSSPQGPVCKECNDGAKPCDDCLKFHECISGLLNNSSSSEAERDRNERLSRAVELGRSTNLFDDQYDYEWDA